MDVGTEQDPTLNLVGQWPLQQFMDNSRATGHYRERERERERYAFDPVRNMDIAQLLYWALRNRPTCN